MSSPDLNGRFRANIMDIFADEEQPIEQIIEAEPVAEEAKEPVQDEKGRFAPKGEEQSASPAPVEEPPFEHAAVIGERKRRQEAEERLKTLESELQQLRTPQEPPAPPPSVWEDEQGFGGHLVNVAVSQAQIVNRVQTSEMLMRQAEPEFDALKAEYLALELANPSIIPEVMNDPHPWNKAVQVVKNHRMMRELGATNVAEIEAKLREKLEAEYAAKAQAAPALPNSLADAPAGMGAPASSGTQPFSLADIIGR